MPLQDVTKTTLRQVFEQRPEYFFTSIIKRFIGEILLGAFVSIMLVSIVKRTLLLFCGVIFNF
ncbi:hypothetical protein ACOMICROBIO_EPCKBFOG_04034 [Vibrio sp. B1FLJ16]|nr:hypothetical protein ACOMICROBIO_EPCKBFOG_04034 [Vibrio sp. B1FLJ16]CAE6945890.1 hypothetical protein ACOMICROBIO_EPCKBFOG_04034 [Vibrio sp. B1FLJ16]